MMARRACRSVALRPGAATFKTLTLADVPVLPGAYTLRFDVAVTSASDMPPGIWL